MRGVPPKPIQFARARGAFYQAEGVRVGPDSTATPAQWGAPVFAEVLEVNGSKRLAKPVGNPSLS